MAKKVACALCLATQMCFKVVRGKSSNGSQQVQQEAYTEQVSGGFSGNR
jgi:hypothetical protein